MLAIRKRSQKGQAAVELALCFPLLIVMFLLLAQVGLLMQRQILVIHAAREASREAAVKPDKNSIESAARSRTALPSDRLLVRYSVDKKTVKVGVQFDDPTDVPLVGLLLPDVKLQSQVTTHLEN